jgi:hypothetical protein
MKKAIAIFLLVTALFACQKSDNLFSKKELPERTLDKFQTLILEIIEENHEITGVPFVTYEVMDIEEDTFYKRYYVYALTDDIDEELNVICGYVYPFAFTFDKEDDSLVRAFFPNEESTNEDIFNNFSQKARRKFVSISQDDHVARIDNLRATNLWNAETYYGIEDEE